MVGPGARWIRNTIALVSRCNIRQRASQGALVPVGSVEHAAAVETRSRMPSGRIRRKLRKCDEQPQMVSCWWLVQCCQSQRLVRLEPLLLLQSHPHFRGVIRFSHTKDTNCQCRSCMGRGIWSRFGISALSSLGTDLVPIEVDIGQKIC